MEPHTRTIFCALLVSFCFVRNTVKPKCCRNVQNYLIISKVETLHQKVEKINRGDGGGGQSWYFVQNYFDLFQYIKIYNQNSIVPVITDYKCKSCPLYISHIQSFL